MALGDNNANSSSLPCNNCSVAVAAEGGGGGGGGGATFGNSSSFGTVRWDEEGGVTSAMLSSWLVFNGTKGILQSAPYACGRIVWLSSSSSSLVVVVVVVLVVVDKSDTAGDFVSTVGTVVVVK